MKDILFLLLIFISANGVRPETIPMYDFGFSQIPACTGDSFTLKWTGYHNLHEVDGPSCNSNSISQIHDFQSSGYEETFTTLGAAPGETRYFKCDLHCGSSTSRIEVICCDGRDAPQCNDDVCTWDGSTCCFAQQLNSTTNTCPGSEGSSGGGDSGGSTTCTSFTTIVDCPSQCAWDGTTCCDEAAVSTTTGTCPNPSGGSATTCSDFTTNNNCPARCNWDGYTCCDELQQDGTCSDSTIVCSDYTQFSECQSPCQWDGYDCCDETVNGACPSSGSTSTDTCSDHTTSSACSSPCNWDYMKELCCDEFVEGACPDPSGGSGGGDSEGGDSAALVTVKEEIFITQQTYEFNVQSYRSTIDGFSLATHTIESKQLIYRDEHLSFKAIEDSDVEVSNATSIEISNMQKAKNPVQVYTVKYQTDTGTARLIIFAYSCNLCQGANPNRIGQRYGTCSKTSDYTCTEPAYENYQDPFLVDKRLNRDIVSCEVQLDDLSNWNFNNIADTISSLPGCSFDKTRYDQFIKEFPKVYDDILNIREKKGLIHRNYKGEIVQQKYLTSCKPQMGIFGRVEECSLILPTVVAGNDVDIGTIYTFTPYEVDSCGLRYKVSKYLPKMCINPIEKYNFDMTFGTNVLMYNLKSMDKDEIYCGKSHSIKECNANSQCESVGGYCYGNSDECYKTNVKYDAQECNKKSECTWEAGFQVLDSSSQICDGKTYLSTVGKDFTIRNWILGTTNTDRSTWTANVNPELKSTIKLEIWGDYRVRLSPDCNKVIYFRTTATYASVINFNNAKFLNVLGEKLVADILGLDQDEIYNIDDIAWSGDSRYVAMAGTAVVVTGQNLLGADAKDAFPAVHLWDVETGQRLTSTPLTPSTDQNNFVGQDKKFQAVHWTGDKIKAYFFKWKVYDGQTSYWNYYGAGTDSNPDTKSIEWQVDTPFNIESLIGTENNEELDLTEIEEYRAGVRAYSITRESIFETTLFSGDSTLLERHVACQLKDENKHLREVTTYTEGADMASRYTCIQAGLNPVKIGADGDDGFGMPNANYFGLDVDRFIHCYRSGDCSTHVNNGEPEKAQYAARKSLLATCIDTGVPMYKTDDRFIPVNHYEVDPVFGWDYHIKCFPSQRFTTIHRASFSYDKAHAPVFLGLFHWDCVSKDANGEYTEKACYKNKFVGECENCTLNHQISRADLFSCDSCLAGEERREDQYVCTPCPAGKFNGVSGESCKQCPIGKMSSVNAVICNDCPAGKKSNAARTKCIACSAASLPSKPMSSGFNATVNISKYFVKEVSCDSSQGGYTQNGVLFSGTTILTFDTTGTNIDVTAKPSVSLVFDNGQLQGHYIIASGNFDTTDSSDLEDWFNVEGLNGTGISITYGYGRIEDIQIHNGGQNYYSSHDVYMPSEDFLIEATFKDEATVFHAIADGTYSVDFTKCNGVPNNICPCVAEGNCPVAEATFVAGKITKVTILKIGKIYSQEDQRPTIAEATTTKPNGYTYSWENDNRFELVTKQGNGAVFEPVLFEGKIVEVNILSRGEDYSQGIKVLVTDDSYSGDDGFKTNGLPRGRGCAKGALEEDLCPFNTYLGDSADCLQCPKGKFTPTSIMNTFGSVDEGFQECVSCDDVAECEKYGAGEVSGHITCEFAAKGFSQDLRPGETEWGPTTDGDIARQESLCNKYDHCMWDGSTCIADICESYELVSCPARCQREEFGIDKDGKQISSFDTEGKTVYGYCVSPVEYTEYSSTCGAFPCECPGASCSGKPQTVCVDPSSGGACQFVDGQCVPTSETCADGNNAWEKWVNNSESCPRRSNLDCASVCTASNWNQAACVNHQITIRNYADGSQNSNLNCGSYGIAAGNACECNDGFQFNPATKNCNMCEHTEDIVDNEVFFGDYPNCDKCAAAYNGPRYQEYPNCGECENNTDTHFKMNRGNCDTCQIGYTGANCDTPDVGYATGYTYAVCETGYAHICSGSNDCKGLDRDECLTVEEDDFCFPVDFFACEDLSSTDCANNPSCEFNENEEGGICTSKCFNDEITNEDCNAAGYCTLLLKGSCISEPCGGCASGYQKQTVSGGNQECVSNTTCPLDYCFSPGVTATYSAEEGCICDCPGNFEGQRCDECAPGYTGYYCNICDEGYYRVGTVCTVCAAGTYQDGFNEFGNETVFNPTSCKAKNCGDAEFGTSTTSEDCLCTTASNSSVTNTSLVNYCSGHGDFKNDGYGNCYCDCDYLWTGAYCSERRDVCDDNPCVAVGTQQCINKNTEDYDDSITTESGTILYYDCQCKDGYEHGSERKCELSPQCDSSHITCQNGGTPKGSILQGCSCDCPIDYPASKSDDCSVPRDCTDALDCSNNGITYGTFGSCTCDCNGNYGGDSCDQCIDGYTGAGCGFCASGYKSTSIDGYSTPFCLKTCSTHTCSSGYTAKSSPGDIICPCDNGQEACSGKGEGSITCDDTTCCDSVVTYDFGFKQIQACEGDTFALKWKGYHNLHEVDGASCHSLPIKTITDYHNTGHIQIFTDLWAEKGTTRYFKCDIHCGEEASRIEVSCPGDTVDCVGSWSAWSACANDKQVRTYSVTTAQGGDGVACENNDGDTQEMVCDSTPPELTSGQHFDVDSTMTAGTVVYTVTSNEEGISLIFTAAASFSSMFTLDQNTGELTYSGSGLDSYVGQNNVDIGSLTLKDASNNQRTVTLKMSVYLNACDGWQGAIVDNGSSCECKNGFEQHKKDRDCLMKPVAANGVVRIKSEHSKWWAKRKPTDITDKAARSQKLLPLSKEGHFRVPCSDVLGDTVCGTSSEVFIPKQENRKVRLNDTGYGHLKTYVPMEKPESGSHDYEVVLPNGNVVNIHVKADDTYSVNDDTTEYNAGDHIIMTGYKITFGSITVIKFEGSLRGFN